MRNSCHFADLNHSILDHGVESEIRVDAHAIAFPSRLIAARMPNDLRDAFDRLELRFPIEPRAAANFVSSAASSASTYRA